MHIKWTKVEILPKVCAMKKPPLPTPPAFQRQLTALGLRMRLARERRKLGTELFAERVGVSRETLRRLEKGDASIALGTFLRALRVLGLDRDIGLLAADDELGRKLQDIELLGNRLSKEALSTSSPGAGTRKK
jgi:transcriptional regulator with XRE-family HTH domain